MKEEEEGKGEIQRGIGRRRSMFFFG